jgi:hypothetical protein
MLASSFGHKIGGKVRMQKRAWGSSSQVEAKRKRIRRLDNEKRAMLAWPRVHNSEHRGSDAKRETGRTGEAVPWCPWVDSVSESESDRLFTHQHQRQPSAITGQGPRAKGSN